MSIMGIRKAGKKELNVIKLEDLNFTEEDLSLQTMIEQFYLPPETEGAEIIEGDPSAVAEEILRIMKEKGVNV